MALSLPTSVDDSKVQQCLDAIAKQFPIQGGNLGAPASLVTSLPTKGLFDGRHIIYKADATNGVYWELVYDGEGEYPWKKIGGPPLFAEVTTQEETASAAYTGLATAGPSLTIPLEGDYDIDVACLVQVTEATQRDGNMSYKIGGTAASDSDRAVGSALNSGATKGNEERRKTKLAASTVILAQYKASAGTVRFSHRQLRLNPVRVG